MKKQKGMAMALCLAMVCAVGSACGGNGGQSGAGEKVYLRAIADASAVGTVDADYFLLAEPAVTAQSKKGYFVKGDLQDLYGGEQGYPQAVLVAKSELVASHGAWVSAFAQKVAEAAAWLQTATGEEVVSAVSSHVADKEYATSLKAPMLTADVMARCGVWFASAKDSKMEVQSFIGEMLEINATATAMPSDGFFWDMAAESGAGLDREVTVCMPDGAPALALAKLLAEDTADDGVTYEVVNASLIQTKVNFSDMNKNADLCILPVTAACKLLGNGEKYKMVGVATHGNLYLIAKDGEVLNGDTMSALKGKTIGVLQMNAVPGLTLKAVLNKYSIAYEEVKTV